MALQIALKQGEWTCLCNPEQVPLTSDIKDIEALIRRFQNFPTTLKDNHRSMVKRGNLFGKEIVAKRPLDKNRRLWARFLSLWAEGEAAATVSNLAKLRSAGIESVAPVLALVRRRHGMIIDSWMCYEYREGEPCGAKGLREIIVLLNEMHAAGFRHDDPTFNNFLKSKDDVLFTIDTKAKPCRGAFHATNDFVVLKRANKLHDFDLRTVDELDRLAPGYWLAMVYMVIKAGRSLLKDKLKRNRPKNT